ncbi:MULTISPECIES: hypothetical protein [unclassified Streptomyces]|uniref:hypothetical protein n=1 Tax=unclassified Streptomyces TaxID=2593676 RepID=UPI0035D99871
MSRARAPAPQRADADGHLGHGLVFGMADHMVRARLCLVEETRLGDTVLDGAVFGPPPAGQRAARPYLAGEAQAVDAVQPVFEDTALQVLARVAASAPHPAWLTRPAAHVIGDELTVEEAT